MLSNIHKFRDPFYYLNPPRPANHWPMAHGSLSLHFRAFVSTLLACPGCWRGNAPLQIDLRIDAWRRGAEDVHLTRFYPCPMEQREMWNQKGWAPTYNPACHHNVQCFAWAIQKWTKPTKFSGRGRAFIANHPLRRLLGASGIDGSGPGCRCGRSFSPNPAQWDPRAKVRQTIANFCHFSFN